MKVTRSVAEKLYIIILTVSYTASGIYLLSMGLYNAESVILCGLVIAIGYWYALQLSNLIGRDSYHKRRLYFEINYKRFNFFMTIYLLIMIIYGIKTGDGAAQKAELQSHSIFASLWVPNSIFTFYYCLCREKYKTFTRINAVIYILYRILLGWTSVLLLVAIFEIYYLFKNKNINIFKVVGITVLSFVGGGFLYSILYPLKYSIRYSVPFGFSNRLSFLEGLNHLTNRIAHLDVSLFVNNYSNAVVQLYKQQNVTTPEFQAIFRPLIPGFLMKEKIFSSIGSCIYNARSGYRGINITDNCGILYYYKLLIQCNVLDFILCGLMFVFFVWLLKILYNMFQTEPNQFQILYFWMFMSYGTCGTLENWIANSYIKIIFFIPLLVVLGVIKPKYKKKMGVKE